MHAISKIIINSIENNKKIIIPKYLKDKLTISEGYYIQNEVNNFFSINNIFKGWKIGCTTPVMQKYLGIPNPCLGKVRAKNLFEGDTKLKFENFSNPGVECEIAVILSDEYDYKKKYDNLEDLISKVVSSIEVVDDRWPNYKKESTPLLIADNKALGKVVYRLHYF